jgi:hypothetical protein
MKSILLCCALVMVSCGKREAQEQARPSDRDETQIQRMVVSLYDGLARAYNVGGMNTDSLIDAYYEQDIRYVTPWGDTEPIDTTKARLRSAVKHLRDFNHRIEAVQVKSYGDGAYAFFILRQSYSIDGRLLEEYLPTTLILERRGSSWKIVHAHRSTDYSTIQQYVALQQEKTSGK